MAWLMGLVVSGVAGFFRLSGERRASGANRPVLAGNARMAGLRRDGAGVGVRLLIALLAGAGALHGAAAQAELYSITDLGSLGGNYTNAYGINNGGQVVGFDMTKGKIHAFLYSGGIMSDLGTLGGTYSEAKGISNNGQIVGVSNVIGDATYHAFMYSGSIISDLGTLSGASNSYAYGINNSGQIVGVSDPHAFFYSGGVMSDLGTLGGTHSIAYGINNSGQIAGYSDIAGNVASHAFLYSGGIMNDLGTLGGAYSYAYSINDSGHVVGWSQTSDAAHHAFLYSGGGMSDLGTLGGSASSALGINASGQVVGFSDVAGDAIYHAFIYNGGIMTDLNTLLVSNDAAWILYKATAINDAGQITGTGITNGHTHAFLLSPITLEIIDPLCAAQTTCSTAKFLTQQNGMLRLTQNPATLMQANVQRDGTAADGTTLMLLRMRSDNPVTFKLKPEDGSTPTEQANCLWGRLESLDGSAGSCKTLTVQPQDVPNVGKVVFAVFHAPDGVPQTSSASYQVTRNLTVEAASSSATANQSLSLQAPPVILIHGVWSSAKAWRMPIQGMTTGFENNLRGLGLDVYLVDHSQIGQSASSFDPNENAQVFQQVDSLTGIAKDGVRSKGNHGLAITQVDVVGHSMGGLIARARTVAKVGLAYKRPDNGWQGDFHKIITIGTPHRGTRLADTLVENNCQTTANIKGKLACMTLGRPTLQEFFACIHRPIGPAVLGFQTGSVPIQNIGATAAPSSAIIGIAPETSHSEDQLNDIMRWFLVNATVDGLLGGNGNHDTIVPFSSQAGGILNSATTQIAGVVHADLGGDVGETQSANVFNRVKALLLAPARSSPFAHFAGLESGGIYNSLRQCPAAALSTSEPMPADLAITMLPAPGTVVTPGQVVTLTFDVAGGPAPGEGLFVVDETLHHISGSPPYSLDYTVPKGRAGIISIVVFAFGSQNYAAETSLKVLPAQAPTQLTATPASLRLAQQNASFPLAITGVYADGSQIDLTAAEAGTSYATQSGNAKVVSVSAAGLVTARATGQDAVVASNSGKTATVAVTVNITNRAPVIQIEGGVNLSMRPGEIKTLAVKATDPEGNAVALSLLEPPKFAALGGHFNNASRLVLEPLPADIGTHSFHIYALDNGNPPLGTTAAIRVQVGTWPANKSPND